MRLQPADAQGAYLLGELLARTGRPGEAREALRPLLRAGTPAREALQLLVSIDRGLHDDTQLREHSELLNQLYPEVASDSGQAREVRP